MNVVGEDDKALCCDSCLFWFHITCVNITETLYDSIDSNDDDASDGYAQSAMVKCVPFLALLKVKVMKTRLQKKT